MSEENYFTCKCGNPCGPWDIQDHRTPIDCNPNRTAPYEKIDPVNGLIVIKRSELDYWKRKFETLRNMVIGERSFNAFYVVGRDGKGIDQITKKLDGEIKRRMKEGQK